MVCATSSQAKGHVPGPTPLDRAPPKPCGRRVTGEIIPAALSRQAYNFRENPARTPTGGQEASVAMRLKVVVVDDEPDFCKSTAMLVESLGHEAHAFHSGRDVLHAVEKIRPDLILSDLTMPHMDGFELARRLRQTVAGKQAVLVAITGLATEEHRQLVVRAGFDFRLVKPVTIEELRWLLEEVVGQRGAR